MTLDAALVLDLAQRATFRRDRSAAEQLRVLLDGAAGRLRL